METLVQDTRAALRQFRNRPGFTLAVVLVLALGLGANTAIFTVVDAFLLRPLPFPQPDRLTALFEHNILSNDEPPFNEVAPGTFADWQRLSASFERLAAYTTGSANLATPGSGLTPQRAQICYCSGSLFSTLGVRPALGRDFRADEDRYGAPHVAIISYGLWQQRFGGASNIVGRRIHLDMEPTEIIGVMPRDFAFPSREIEVWSPLQTGLPPALAQRHDSHFLLVVGRLRPGVSVAAARSEIDGIDARYWRLHQGEVVSRGGNVVSLHEALVRDVRTPLLILLGAVGCVLLIACINVANLLLTRGAGRMREISIRAAIGAGRGRIVRQLLTESLLLALTGAAAGLLLAVSITDILLSRAPNANEVLPAGAVGVNGAVFLFAFALALIAGAAAGLFPAIQTSRADLVSGLRDSSRSATAGRAQGRLRRVLVTSEVAISLALLIAAGLLLRSFGRLYQVNPGVRIDHTLTMGLSLPDAMAAKPATVAAFEAQMSERLSSLPGVISAGLVTCPPVSGHCNDRVFMIEGRPTISGQMLDALTRGAGPGYFAAAGIPLVRGRTFLPQDGIGFDPKHPLPGVAVISESAAKKFFRGEDPIGRRIWFGGDVEREQVSGEPVPRYRIVGIVGDVLTHLDSRPEPTIYTPLNAARDQELTAVFHTAGDPRGEIAAAQSEIARLNPDLAVYDVRTMEQVLGQSVAGRQFNMLLFSAFAALALLLAAIGLYGVLSYSVSQRRSEIGIRMALGADRGNVSGLILREGMKPAVIGVALGLIAAALVSSVLKSLLFGVAPNDPLTFVVVPVVLLSVSALACYIPAVRAARVDPTVALRTE